MTVFLDGLRAALSLIQASFDMILGFCVQYAWVMFAVFAPFVVLVIHYFLGMFTANRLGLIPSEMGGLYGYVRRRRLEGKKDRFAQKMLFSDEGKKWAYVFIDGVRYFRPGWRGKSHVRFGGKIEDKKGKRASHYVDIDEVES